MHFPFPTINHIDEVIEAIKGRPEFVVAKRDGFQVINYFVNMEDTFPPVNEVAGGSKKDREAKKRRNAILRECRGLVFDYEGKVIARRFHKFFNVGERLETLPDKIDLTKPHHLMEKLDGSMITPIPITKNGELTIRWGTKMGTTDVASQAEKFVKENPEYEAMARRCVTLNLTPIFEWLSRKQRIVVDHPEDKLVLLAIRNNVTGEYDKFENMRERTMALFPSIPVVKIYSTGQDILSVMNDVNKEEGSEGFIIRFDDGHMVKIKTEWYVRIHKAKEILKFEKDILSLIVNEKLDDVIPLLTDDEINRIRKYESDVVEGINAYVWGLEIFMKEMKKLKWDRKEFAMKSEEVPIPDNNLARPIIFSSWDDQSTIRENVLDYLKRHVSSASKVDHIRPIIGRKARW